MQILERRADFIALNGIDRWIGGVHLTRGNVWRYDPQKPNAFAKTSVFFGNRKCAPPIPVSAMMTAAAKSVGATPSMREPPIVKHRTDCVSGEESRRMQRDCRAARSRRDFRGRELKAVVHHVKADAHEHEGHEFILPGQS